MMHCGHEYTAIQRDGSDTKPEGKQKRQWQQTVSMLARAFVLLRAMSHLVPVEDPSCDSLASLVCSETLMVMWLVQEHDSYQH